MGQLLHGSAATTRAGPGIAYARTGFGEMDEVRGSGSVDLLKDGALEISFEYENGDAAVLKAVRERSTTTC